MLLEMTKIFYNDKSAKTLGSYNNHKNIYFEQQSIKVCKTKAGRISGRNSKFNNRDTILHFR